MNTYILQKDLPDAKAGCEMIRVHNEGRWFYIANVYLSGCKPHIEYLPEFVEYSPEWFKFKEEKTVVDLLGSSKEGKYNYGFRCSKEIDLIKFKSKIEKAIEFIINECK